MRSLRKKKTPNIHQFRLKSQPMEKKKNMKVEIKSVYYMDIPKFIQVLKWLQNCPIKELEISCDPFTLQKLEEKKENGKL